MGDVVKMSKGTTLVTRDPKDILRDVAKNQKLSYVLVLGWTEDHEFFVSSNSSDLMEANYIANRLITWIHVDGGAHDEEGEGA